jgi:FkbM family methyltransferase
MTDFKKGFIVTYFKSTPDGEKILIDLINTISKMDVYLVLGSHSSDVPLEIQKKCDFYFYQELNVVDDRKYSHGVAENNIIEIALQHLKWKGIEWTFKSCYDIIVNDTDRFNDWVKNYEYKFVSCNWGDNFLATHSFFANVDFILNNIRFYKTVEEMFSVNTVLENCWQRDIELSDTKHSVFSYPSKVDMYGDNQIDVVGYNYSNFEFWYNPSEFKFYVKNNGEDYFGDIRIFDYYSDVCLYYEKNFRHDSGITMWISPPMFTYIPLAKNGYYLELYKNGITIRKNIMISDFNYKDPLHKKFRTIKFKESKFNEYIEFDDLMEYSVLNIDTDSIKTFVDIGANYGFSSVPFIRNGVKTYMIEGDVNNAQILNEMYGNSNSIKIIDKVISDIDGEIDLYIDDVYSTISSIFEIDANGKSDNKNKITVPSITPNTLIENYIEEDSIDLMKVDIEGAEYKLFESITDSNLKKVSKLMIEFHINYNYEVLQILKKLTKNGFYYKLYNLPLDRTDYVIEQNRGFIYAWR